MDEAAGSLQMLRNNLAEVIHGKVECIEILLTALLAEGSVLIEDVPGVGKTTLAAALARSIDCTFNRIQFTPDLLPADVIGSSIYNPVTGSFDFRKGPVFCNILLADEINRASPRTQSALLEAMNDNQVTAEGITYPLSSPFLVLATQNPIDFHGTYPLPESQLDRFMLRMSIGYPDEKIEADLINTREDFKPVRNIQPVICAEKITALQKTAKKVHIEQCISDYIIKIVNSTRKHPEVKFGVSTRGTLMLASAARARALLNGRHYVIPDDIRTLAHYVLPHRLVMNSASIYSGSGERSVIDGIISSLTVPV